MKKIGIIGVGKMGSAILNSMINSGIYKKEDFILSAHSKNSYYKELGFLVTDDVNYLLNNVELVMLAVKPQVFNEIFISLNYSNKNITVLSILAGIKIERIKECFKTENIIRAMPNTPLLVNMGVTSLSKSKNVNEEAFKMVKDIFDKVGSTIIIDEDMIDAFIPLSGSMPAYLDTFIKHFVDNGINYGFNKEEALKMVLDTLKGNVKLIEESNKNLDELIKDVTSKGGTTEAGLKALNENGFKKSIDECFKSTYNRSKELGK